MAREDDEMLSTQSLPAASTALKSLCYDESYYEEHKRAGLDFLGHGYWQASYAAMVSEATLQDTYAEPRLLDAGCACGSILAGFKKTGIFQRVMGVDLSAHMVNMGRKAFGLAKDEIVSGSIDEVPVPDATFTLVHSAQVLEHIPDESIGSVLAELARVLLPGGRAFLCLDAVRHGETKEAYMGDPTHCNIRPILYWTTRLQAHGLYFDIEAYNRFIQSPLGPTDGDPRSFYEAYPHWSVWTLIKAE